MMTFLSSFNKAGGISSGLAAFRRLSVLIQSFSFSIFTGFRRSSKHQLLFEVISPSIEALVLIMNRGTIFDGDGFANRYPLLVSVPDKLKQPARITIDRSNFYFFRSINEPRFLIIL